MSTENGSLAETISDDEGIVDRKTKEHILNLRAQVDEDERRLYVDLAADPEYNLGVAEANMYWGVSVRQYLRGIKRLWSDADDTVPIKKVDQYWPEGQDSILVGRVELVPPDRGDYRFSLVEHRDRYDAAELRRAIGLPRGADLPEIRGVAFRGLNSILRRNRIGHTWVVTTDTSGPPSEHETVELAVQRPIPKHVLENAVEAADNFLQQAGVGFETNVPAYKGEGGPGL